jgi:hypothetical protein
MDDIPERWHRRASTLYTVENGLPDVSFHDAEVREVRLDRDGPTLEMEVEVFAQLPEARMIRLRFTGVTDLEMGGLNEQNVLFDLRAEALADDSYAVTMDSTYGLGGSFHCARITTVAP